MMFPKGYSKKKKATRSAKKKTPRKSLEARLDKYFSLYVRLRACSLDMVAKCVTCGKYKSYDLGDCGHFITRAKKIIRWNPNNAHFQCSKCNRFEHGRQYEHGLAIDKMYGEGTAKRLYEMSQVPYFKHSLPDLEGMLDDYKRLVRLEKMRLGMNGR